MTMTRPYLRVARHNQPDCQDSRFAGNCGAIPQLRLS